jgi:predicted RNA-binding protein Jag
LKSAEGRGRTLDEAVDAALIELKESRRNVDVKVISENPDETIVEVVVIDPDASGATAAAPANGKAEVARGMVEGLLKHMGVRAQVTVRTGTEPITLDISGRDLGALIGWRGARRAAWRRA